MTWERLELVGSVRDGRQWGDKKPEKIAKFTRNGEKYRKVTKDSWEGPGSYDPDQEHYHPTGQYHRTTFLEWWNEKPGRFPLKDAIA